MSDPSTQETAEIAGLFDSWNAALATGDARAVADLYAPDAVLLPTISNRPRTDRAGIIDYFEEFLQAKPQGRITQSHLRRLGDLGGHSGVYIFALTGPRGRHEAAARFTFVYRRDPEGWRIIEHHSSLMPE